MILNGCCLKFPSDCIKCRAYWIRISIVELAVGLEHLYKFKSRLDQFLYSGQVSKYFSNANELNNKTKESSLDHINKMIKKYSKEMLNVLSNQTYVSYIPDTEKLIQNIEGLRLFDTVLGLRIEFSSNC